MKTAQLPPIRVAPSVREEIENALHEGESLSEFVETAALQVARRRKAQEEFLARGRASLAKARKTGKLTPLPEALDQVQARAHERLRTQLPGRRSARKP